MQHRTSSARGLTLVELLVVIVILSTITVAVIPAVTPSNEARQLREAARGVNSFFSGARARAIASGRPVGVQIRRLSGEPQAALELVYVHTPPVYAGNTLNATCTLRITSAPSSPADPFQIGAITTTPGSINTAIVQIGDLVRFGHKGYFYQITDRQANNMTLRVFTNGAPLPWPGPGGNANDRSNPVSFQVFRQPTYQMANGATAVAAASADTFTLPSGTAVDLQSSHFPGVPLTGDDTQPITVMFSPNGNISGVYAVGASASNGGNPRFAPAGMIHLLVGRRENVPAPASPGDRSAQNTNSLNAQTFWVSISNINGQVSTAEMFPSTDLFEARTFTRAARGMGGR